MCWQLDRDLVEAHGNSIPKDRRSQHRTPNGIIPVTGCTKRVDTDLRIPPHCVYNINVSALDCAEVLMTMRGVTRVSMKTCITIRLSTLAQ